MKFRYSPEGAEPKEWPFKANKLLNAEAEEIERRTAMTFGEWAAALERQSMRAFHALLYVMLKRENPTLQWDQVVFSGSEVELELELDEMVDARDKVRQQLNSGDFDDGRREQAAAALAALDAEIAEQAHGEPEAPETPVLAAGEEPPKASPSSGRHGGPPSPLTSISGPVSSTA